MSSAQANGSVLEQARIYLGIWQLSDYIRSNGIMGTRADSILDDPEIQHFYCFLAFFL